MVVRTLAAALFLAYLCARVAQRIGLPYAIGALVVGVCLGSAGAIEAGVASASSTLRWLAFVVVLLRAGTSLKAKDVVDGGGIVARLCVLPLLCEASVIFAMAIGWLGWDATEAGMLGFAVSPLSPALVIPAMLAFSEQQRGREPNLVLIAAPLEVVLGTTCFSVFKNMHSGGAQEWWVTVLFVLLAVFGAMAVGCLAGYLLFKLIQLKDNFEPETLAKAGVGQSPVENLLLLLSFTLAANAVCEAGNLSSELAILAVAFVFSQCDKEQAMTKALAENLKHVWYFAELSLFFLIGAELDVSQVSEAGGSLPAILICGMLGRGLGVMLAFCGSTVPLKGRLFGWIATMPKATVQAALGGQALDVGVVAERGQYILTASVCAVAVFATAGVVMTNAFVDRLVGPPATSPSEDDGGTTQAGEGASAGGGAELELAAFVGEEQVGAERDL